MKKMFRGRTRPSWEKHFREAGWPPLLAGLMAAWVTGEGPLPHWPADGKFLRFGDHVTGGGPDQIKQGEK